MTKEFSFLWFIENYSHCWHKNGEALNSQVFTIDTLHGIQWMVTLYPRGKCEETADFISLYLKKNRDGVDPEIPFRYDLSLLAEDGSVLCRKTHEDVLQCEYPKLVKIVEVLERKGDDSSSKDTLNVQLKIRLGEEPIQTISRITARTRIAYTKHYFFNIVKNFSQLRLNQTEECEIDLGQNGVLFLNTTLYRTDDSSTEEKIMCALKSSNIKFISKCELTVYDAAITSIQHFTASNLFGVLNNDIIHFLFNITKQEIVAHKDKYLTDDDGLIMSCKIIFTTGLQFDKMEEYTFSVPAGNDVGNQ